MIGTFLSLLGMMSSHWFQVDFQSGADVGWVTPAAQLFGEDQGMADTEILNHLNEELRQTLGFT